MARQSKGATGDAWLVELRPRMLAIARRRVPEDEAEDVVQTAMGIILERAPQAGSTVDGTPSLAWCLQVLRNVIGNHYRRTRTRRRHLDGSIDVETIDVPIEGLRSQERLRLIDEGLQSLDAPCRDYLERMAEGATAHEVAIAHDLEAHALYQRLYRCRRKLREFLRAKGVLS